MSRLKKMNRAELMMKELKCPEVNLQPSSIGLYFSGTVCFMEVKKKKKRQ